MSTGFNTAFTAIYLSDQQLANALHISNEDLVEISLSKIKTLFPDKKIYCNTPLKGVEYIPTKAEYDFLSNLNNLLPESQIADEDIDEVFFCYMKGFYPLLNFDLTNELLNRHMKYMSQYSFSENIPPGLVPVFISREFINTLNITNVNAHEYLIKNINNFDVEIFYEPPDLRQYRLDFTLSDYRSLKLIRYFSTIKNLKYATMLDEILKHPEVFRSFPSWIELEIYRGCEYSCTFCPRQFIDNSKDGSQLSLEQIKKIASEINEFFPDDLTICLGGMGEPLLHEDLNSILKEFSMVNSIKEILIETSFSTDIQRLIETLENMNAPEKRKISIIVNLTTLDSRKYKDIYGKDELEIILAKIDQLLNTLDAKQVHVQMIKMKEVEEEVEKYFNYFENKNINVILQKYNRYADLMPEKRVSDLTPVKREFCWHLLRDMYIRSDGAVSLCRISMDDSLGNIQSSTLEELWDKGLSSADLTLKGKDNEINAPCLSCDEWYTFNA